MDIEVHIRIPHRPEILIEYELSPELTLKTQVVPICHDVGLQPEEYRLAHEEDGQSFYLTEENRGSIKKGDTLFLLRSPTLLAQTSRDDLETHHNKLTALTKLETLIQDPLFARKFADVQGIHSLVRNVQWGYYNGVYMGRALKIIDEFLSLEVLDENVFNEHFIVRVCSELNPDGDYKENIVITLSVLERVAKYMPNEVAAQLSVLHLMRNMGQTVGNCLKAAAKLVNTLLLTCDHNVAKALVKAIHAVGPEYSGKILDKYSQSYANKNAQLDQAVFVFQTLCLRVSYLDLYNQREDVVTSSEFNAFMERVLKTELGWRDSQGRRYMDSLKIIGGVPEEFEDILMPGEKFLINVRQLDSLTLRCLLYFEEHHRSVLYSWMREINLLSLEYICPLLNSSILLVDLVVDILHIDKDPLPPNGNFFRMFLSNTALFFMDFFCMSLKLVLKTWREMRACSGDLYKVFNIVREQLTRAMSNHLDCWSFQDLQDILNARPYAAISQQLEKERMKNTDTKKQANLKLQLTDKIWALIKECKILKLIEGTDFQRIGDRQTRIKNKITVVRLSNDRRLLRIILDHKNQSIPVDQVLQVTTNRQCSHYKKDDYCLSILTKEASLRPVHVATPDEGAMHDLWDAINALLGRPMESKSAINDFKELMDLEVKLVMLELENIDLPQEGLAVPEDPDNYDFRSALGSV